MKVFTLHQPWASLVALGVKTIETRSWSTQYRGPLAIHAAASLPSEGYDFATSEPARSALGVRGVRVPHMGYNTNSGGKRRRLPGGLPLGAIVATCTLVDVVPIVEPGDGVDFRTVVAPFVAARTFSDAALVVVKVWADASVEDVSDQLPYGDFTPSRYAWLLADIAPVDPPAPFKGGQGLTKTWEPVAA